MRIFSDIYWIFWREMKRFLLQRARIVTSVVQPIIWLVLVGSSLTGLTRGPQATQFLGTENYLQFMTPGIMIMTTLFGGVYGGTTVLWDRRLGILNKLLASPIPRAAIPLGKLAGMMVQSWIQVVVILIIALFLGVRIATGLPGVLFLIGMASLFGILMGGISLSLAANLKSIENLFAIMNFLTLPLIFTSNAIFPLRAMPGWLQAIAIVNPLTYAVTPMRIAVTQGWVWNEMWTGVLILAIMATLSVTLAITQFNRTIG